MPKDTAWRKVIQSIIADQIKAEGMMLLGWRDVPSDNSSLGVSVKPTEPTDMQVFIGRNGAAILWERCTAKVRLQHAASRSGVDGRRPVRRPDSLPTRRASQSSGRTSPRCPMPTPARVARLVA